MCLNFMLEAFNIPDYGTRLLDEITINPNVKPPELIKDWANTFGEHRQNLVHTRAQEKGAVTTQETNPDLPMSVHKSPVEVWVSGRLL